MATTLLAFDTSTEAMAVALCSVHGLQAWNGEGGAQASATLLPRIHALMALHGLSIRQLDAIAFGSGPGAFTGLRTACAVAQGLALGQGIPMVAVDSLLIVAEDARRQAGAAAASEVGVVMDARMGEVYAGRYRWLGDRWQVVAAPALWDPILLVRDWASAGPGVVAGSGVQLVAAHLPQARILGATQDRAAALLQLACRLHADGQGVDAALALPAYLRDKVALTTQERVERAAAGP